MERFIDLGRDMSLLWENYKGSFFLGSGYLGGIRNTLVLAVVAVFTAAANPMVYLTGNSTMVAFLMLLVALAGAVITVIASYFFYTALDDLAVVRGYDYPAGRIKWCFWLSIIIAVASAVLELAMPGAARIGSLVLQVVILVLLWQYLQAVRRSEQGE